MVSKYSVKKPYTVLVGVLLTIVLGVVALTRMTTDLLPDMSLQYALIITTDIGASPEKIEMEVTAPIEASIATTTGIKKVGSMSYNSYSVVTCEYDQNANMDSVVIEIQQKLDQLSGSWGDGVGTPMIMQMNPDMLPVMTAAVDIDGLGALEIADYVDRELIPALESLEGVASVSASGQLKESVKITLDETKIEALNTLIQKEVDSGFQKPESEIESAISKINQGKDAMKDAPDKIDEAMNQAMEGKEKLSKAEKELQVQYESLKTQRDSLKKMIGILFPVLDLRAHTIEKLDGLKETIPEQENAVKAAEEKCAELEKLIAEDTTGNTEELQKELAAEKLKKTEAEAVLLTTKTAVEEAEKVKTELDQKLLGHFEELNASGLIKVETAEDIEKIKPTLQKALVQIENGLVKMEEGLKMLGEQKEALPDVIAMLNAEAAKAAMEMGPAAAELSTAAAALEDAKNSLEETKKEALDAADMSGTLTVDLLSRLIMAQNFDMPAGYAYDGKTQYFVRVGESVRSIEELENLVLMDMGMDSVGQIRICDVANLEVVDNSDETYAIINGNPGVVLSFEKQTGYSTGEVTDRLLEKFQSLEKTNKDLTMTVLMDQGIYIDMIVRSVMENMIVGAVLAVIVLLFFLKDFRPTIVIACSIPLSVITAIVLMYFTDISLNIISMSGLMLGIGMLVDNSIVVIENIYRLRGEGYSIRKACVEGSGQVAGAIVASTLTTVSVYVPIIFTEGMTRQLFVDLALTVAFTLGASLLVALTVVPAMSSFTLRTTKEVRTPWFDRFKNIYGKALANSLRHKPLVFSVSVLLLVLSTMLSLSKGLSFMDMDMETNQLGVTISPPEGEILTLEELTDLSDQVLEKISDIEGIGTIGATAGENSAMSLMGGSSQTVSMYILLDEHTDVTTKQISKEILSRTKELNCEITTDASSMDFTAMFGQGLSLKIKGNDIGQLQKLAEQAAEILDQTEGTVNIEDGLDETIPQWKITVDKEKAAEYGMTVAQVYQLVYGKMASNRSAATISTDLKDYEVYLQTEEQSDLQLEDIKNLSFTYTDKEGKESEIPLTEICTMTENRTLSTIYRDAQTRYLTVSCGIDEKHNVTLVSSEVQKKLNALEIPEGYEIEMAGEDETINESMSQMLLMMTLAVIFIYLIMVAQFQSLMSPFIILFSIPLAFTGGFLALFLSGKEVSVIAMLGFIMLAGLIVNNGIVLIDYINQARAEGKSKKEAIVEAGVTRLRPILMTALTTILAMSTSALGMGEGSEMMQPMAITIIGGLTYGTVLTLIVIPCIYDAFTKEKNMTEEEL